MITTDKYSDEEIYIKFLNNEEVGLCFRRNFRELVRKVSPSYVGASAHSPFIKETIKFADFRFGGFKELLLYFKKHFPDAEYAFVLEQESDTHMLGMNLNLSEIAPMAQQFNSRYLTACIFVYDDKKNIFAQFGQLGYNATPEGYFFDIDKINAS